MKIVALLFVASVIATAWIANGPSVAAFCVPNAVTGECMPDENDLPQSCDTGSGSALAVTPTIGAGENVYRLYKSALGEIYAGWAMMANTLQFGADRYYFGIGIQSPNPNYDPYDPGGGPAEFFFGNAIEDQHAACHSVGTDGGGFSCSVNSGAIGWEETLECTVTAHWDFSIGVVISLEPAATGEFTFGESGTCESGQTVDSELLIDGGGQCSNPCVAPGP